MNKCTISGVANVSYVKFVCILAGVVGVELASYYGIRAIVSDAPLLPGYSTFVWNSCLAITALFYGLKQFEHWIFRDVSCEDVLFTVLKKAQQRLMSVKFVTGLKIVLVLPIAAILVIVFTGSWARYGYLFVTMVGLLELLSIMAYSFSVYTICILPIQISIVHGQKNEFICKSKEYFGSLDDFGLFMFVVDGYLVPLVLLVTGGFISINVACIFCIVCLVFYFYLIFWTGCFLFRFIYYDIQTFFHNRKSKKDNNSDL